MKEGLWLLVALLLMGGSDAFGFDDGPAEEITPGDPPEEPTRPSPPSPEEQEMRYARENALHVHTTQ